MISIVINNKAILMHDPVSLLAVRSPSCVKNKSLPHPNPATATATGRVGAKVVYGLVPSCSLPKPSCCGSISSASGWVLLILVAEKVPLVLRA